MKKTIFLFFSFVFLLQGAEIFVLKQKDANEDILHLYLKAKTPFFCKIKTDVSLKDKIICFLKQRENNQTINKNFNLFKMSIKGNQAIIEPSYKYYILVKNKPIYEKNIFFDNLKKYKNLEILFFKKTPSYIKQKKADGLNFDIDFKENKDIFIDVLDENLKPIVNTHQTSKLDFLKRLFKKKDYIAIIKNTNQWMEKDNIFNREFLLYNMRALDKLLDEGYENDEYNYEILEQKADQFIKNYPSDKNITEVYYYKIKALLKKGRFKQAYSLMANLNQNFPKDFWSEKSLILKAKSFFDSKRQRGLSFGILENILYSTKFPKNALESAFLLTKYYLEENRPKDAKNFLEKIINFDKNYLIQNKKDSYLMAKRFAELKFFNEAATIAQILSQKSKDEELLKNLAFWEDEAGLKDKAYQDYKKYLKKFPDGKYAPFIQERIDKVLIDIQDLNATKKIKDIEKVLKKYPNDPIAKKALREKVKILLKHKKFKEILALEKSLKDLNQTKYIKIAATKLLDRYLSNQDCLRSVKISEKYHVSVKDKEYKLAKCFYNLARYTKVLDICIKKIKKADKNFVKWYFLAIKSAAKLRKYDLAIKLYEDLKKLKKASLIDTSVYYDIFISYFRLGFVDKALEIVQILERKNPKNPKLLDIYFELVKYYKNEKINLALILYAKKLLKLQKILKVNVYSPMVDIYLIKALKDIKRYKEALKYFADIYLSKNLNSSQKSELLYLAGEISLQMNNLKRAEEFFDKCQQIGKKHFWGELCKDSLDLIKMKKEEL